MRAGSVPACSYEKSKSNWNVLFSGNVLLRTLSEGAQWHSLALYRKRSCLSRAQQTLGDMKWWAVSQAAVSAFSRSVRACWSSDPSKCAAG